MVLELVVAAGVGLALVFVVVSHWRVVPAEDLDTAVQERWLVQHAPVGLRRALRHADRRLVGGAAAAASFVVVLVGAAAVGWMFDGIDDREGLAAWDDAAARWGARRATPSVVRVLEDMSRLGSTVLLFAVMVAVGTFVAWRRRRPAVYGYLALVGAGVVVLNNGLKLLVDRPRPDVFQATHFSGSSFPSGHSASAAACWAAIMLVLAVGWRRPARRAAAVLAVLIAGVVAATRVVLGVHWLSDVVAGLAVGWTWFFVVTLLFGGRLLRFGEPAERIARAPQPPDRPETAGRPLRDRIASGR